MTEEDFPVFAKPEAELNRIFNYKTNLQFVRFVTIMSAIGIYRTRGGGHE